MFVGGPGKQLTLYFSCSKHLWRLDYGVWLDLLFSLINTINAPSLNTSFTFCFLFFLQTTYQLMFLFAIKQNWCIRNFIFSNSKESCPSKKLKTSLPSLTSHDKLSCYMRRNDHPSFFEDLSVSRMATTARVN